jgi:uncharacterized protein involved in outer membrane biogenesis
MSCRRGGSPHTPSHRPHRNGPGMADASSPRVRWLKRAGYVALALVLLTLAVWFAVPPIARSQLESRLSAALDRRTTVESVAFNPFALRLTLRNVAIADRDGKPALLALDEMVADLSSASVWHRAPVVDELKLTRPRISLARNHDGRFNIQDLIERALAPSDGPPPRFSLNNVEIDDGSIAFDDGVTGRKHRLAALAIGVPFLSSLPYETAIRVTPHVGGTFNDARFSLAGIATPFAERRESTIDIDIDDMPLASYVAYLPVKPKVDIAGGSLTTRLKLVFVDSNAGVRQAELRGEARVDGLEVKRRDGSPLASAKRVATMIDRIDLISGDAAIASVAIDAPAVQVKRLADGTIEWTQPMFDEPAAAAQPASSSARASGISIAKLAIEGGTVSLADQTTGFESTLTDVSLSATNLATKPGEKAHVKLAFVTADRVASFSGEGEVEPMVPAATGRFALAKFSLGLLFPYYKSALAVDVQKGSLDLASAFALDANGNLKLTEGEGTISDLRVALSGSRDPLWRIPIIAAKGVDVDVSGRKATIASVRSEGPSLKFIRESDGTLAMSRIVRTSASTSAAKPDDSWTLLSKSIALERVAIDFEDRAAQPPVKLAVRDLALTATDVTNASTGRSSVTLRSRVGERGRIAFAGQVVRSPLRVSGDVDASRLGLVAVKSYIEPRVNVVFTDGTVAAKGKVIVDASNADAVQASWNGNISITDFAALDKPTASDLARWKSLALEGVDVSTNPFKASVSRIGLDDFYARAIVYQDGTLNLARLLTPGESPEPAPEATPPTPSASASTRDALPISIGRVDFDRGNVNFSDFFVKPNYTANLTEVKGSVSTVSAEQAGDVSIVARVDHSAPVEVQGRIHPFAKELSLDINAKARDIDLPPLTPYSVKYAGYGITKGKLAFEVHYQVDNRKLAAENHLILDQLTFGERVDSPTATKLPVLLAVNLLKDSRGVIDIRLPIGGSLDDPQFSVFGLVVRMIVNLIAKAATAPFALLAGAFGGGGDELSTLAFAPGSAAIEPDAQKRIDTLAKALADRPGLRLDIAGRADPDADREALRRASVDTAIKRAKLKSLANEGKAPPSLDQVTIAADERNRWLAQAYRDAPLPDRPRNVIGMLKDIPPAEMEAMLYASAKVDDDALRLLANSRAQAAKDAIAAKGVPAERLFLIAPRIGADQTAGQTAGTLARVDLALG